GTPLRDVEPDPVDKVAGLLRAREVPPDPLPSHGRRRRALREACLDLGRAAVPARRLECSAHRGTILRRDPGFEHRAPEGLIARRAGETRGLAVHESDLVRSAERDDEDVGDLDEIAIPTFELLSFA